MSQSHRKLILPGDPGFYQTLAHPPPESDRSRNFVIRADSFILESVGDRDLDEYLEGGEYDERLQIAEEAEQESDILYLPDSISF